MNTSVILLVEDDFLNRRQAKKILLEKGYQVLEAKNASEALEWMKKESVDLGILDVNLGEGELDGISLGQSLLDKYNLPFIYLTAYYTSSFIDRAISTLPYSYLTKPFKSIDLITAVELALKQSAHKEKHQAKIIVKDEDYQISLPINEINYLESEANYVLFHTDTKIYKSRSTLKQLMETLPTSTFVQVHRAFIVNQKKVEKTTSKFIIVAGKEIPISKGFKLWT